MHVPIGQTLWVDDSTPALEGIVVEGRIVFSDERDITVTTNFITINKGVFEAGTEDHPYENKLIFNMTGDPYKTPLQPFYGTKVIACEACQLSLYAKKSFIRWGLLN